MHRPGRAECVMLATEDGVPVEGRRVPRGTVFVVPLGYAMRLVRLHIAGPANPQAWLDLELGLLLQKVIPANDPRGGSSL